MNSLAKLDQIDQVAQGADKANTIYDIYGIIEQPWWQADWFYVLLACLGLLILIIVIYFFMRRKTISLKASLSPWETALQALEKLDEHNLYTQEQHKHFYSMLTAIVKNYLQERYNLNEGNTDQELLEKLKKRYISEAVLTQLHEVTHHAFMVKFAHHEGQLSQMKADKARVKSIIELTQPQQEKTEASEKADKAEKTGAL